MKRLTLLVIIIAALALLTIVIIIRFGNEDDWIKDGRGVWIKHGNPSNIPEEVTEQQEAITKAIQLWRKKAAEGMIFTSQCLGTAEDYAVDIVNIPRTVEDNLPENQCKDFIEGKVSHFIEFDKDCNLIRIK